MLTQRDLGNRVVVRRVVGVRDGRPQFTDLLGELVALTDEHLTVRDAAGQSVTVPRREVVAAKGVPPRRITRREIVALERIAAKGWPAPDTARLGDWLLRAAYGWTNRGNSVLPLGDPGMPLPDALHHVHEWYAARDLTPRFAVPLPAFADLDRELADRGWALTHTVLVQTAPLTALLAATPTDATPDDATQTDAAPPDTAPPNTAPPDTASPNTAPPDTAPPDTAPPDTAPPDAAPADAPPVSLAERPDADWLAVAVSRKGAIPPGAADVLFGARDPVFASLRDESGVLLATGRGVVDDGWLGLSLMEVTPHARRQGLARRVVGALAEWARQRGARRAYLQVEEDNQPARNLYADVGFTTHHSYVNRAAP